MPTPLVECVPNFSEGRDRAKIKRITDAIEAVSGVTLLNVEPGVDTHRTVVTFVGPPAAVEQAAFAAITTASQVIDMRTHTGAHARMGATDVCPFVPVEGVTMEDCVALARRLGERVGRELGIPVYLYEAAATRPERRNLADIRRGEYEGLAKKLSDPAWKPDFGPAAMNATTGATVIGARPFLIAYNIDLNSTDKNHAADIAFALREKGRVARSGNTAPYYSRGKKLFYRDGAFPCGSCDFVGTTYPETASHCDQVHGYDLGELLRSNDLAPPNVVGKSVYRPGLFRACKAVGWYVKDYDRAQVSINLTDFTTTAPHQVLEASRALAAERGLVVTGSEIVGVVPVAAMMQAGRYYLGKQGRTLGQPASDVLRTAVTSLGLNDVAPFDVRGKVIGLPVVPASALVQRTVLDFTDEVSRDSPAPGGGSVAALAGALGAALASMVANLTYGKEGTEARDAELARVAEEAQSIKEQLVTAVDADSDAFQGFMDALRLPQATPEEKAERARKMQEGLKAAADVPWSTAKASYAAMQLARSVVTHGNPASLSDGAVGVQIAFAGVRGGLWNVLINLKDVSDAGYVAEKRAACASLLTDARALAEEAAAAVDERLVAMIEKR
ncbi:MAG TPA: glutamate formimidoyltransferase [Polyangiaceae bacterium]|jgi:glutamate formiminotransferase/formiminotetrahydrofolate cyclodeaminase